MIGTAGSADAAVALAAESAPDVLVIDPRVADTEAAELIARFRAVAPTTRILVLNWSDTADLDSGADAYARKTFRPHELIDAVVAATRRSLA